jgi:hypothetical protein
MKVLTSVAQNSFTHIFFGLSADFVKNVFFFNRFSCESTLFGVTNVFAPPGAELEN